MNRRPNNQQGSGNNDRNRNRRRRGGGGGGNQQQQQQGGGNNPRPPRQNQEPQEKLEVQKKAPIVLRRYGILFYENHAQARDDAPALQIKAKEVDQLNIVIKAEGTMDDPELLKYGKVFAGEAWHLIHKRRVDDKWYDEPHE